MPEYTATIIQTRTFQIKLESDNESDVDLEIQALSDMDLEELNQIEPVDTNHWIDDITVTE